MKKVILFILFPFALNGEFKLGLENIPDSFIKQLSPDKPLVIGLISNQTGKDQIGRSNVQVLTEKGINIKYIFAPEHGFSGKEQAACDVPNGFHHAIPIISLYRNGSGTIIRDECMHAVDALFFDIQDSGMRHYTYISTLFYALECAAYHNKPIVVLDRPNPLGSIMEGPLVEPPLKSFISIAEIPLRHGMTVGELACFFNTHAIKKKAQLYIIPMREYDRSHGIGSTLQTALSPNIASIDACYGYSFLGLLGEIRPFNVGVGTSQAFQVITLPKNIKLPSTFWAALLARLQQVGISGSLLQQAPKKEYAGIKIHISNINQCKAFTAFLTVVEHTKSAGVTIDFAPNFDKAAGTTKVREYLLGTIAKPTLLQFINEHLNAFIQKAQATFHYQPLPSLSFLHN